METGSNKGLFTLIAIVVFGIFLSLSYFLFKDELVGVLADVMYSTSEMTSQKLDHDGLIPTDESYFSVTTNANGTTCTLTDFKLDATSPTELIIPATIDGLTVTNIAGGAFYNKGLTSIIFPSTVTKIDNYIGERGGTSTEESYLKSNSKREILATIDVRPKADRDYEDQLLSIVDLNESIAINEETGVGRKAFCENCRDMVTYSVCDVCSSKDIKGEIVNYVGRLAICSCCNESLFVPEIRDYNLKELEEQRDLLNG